MAGPRIRVSILGDASGFRRAVKDADSAVGQLEGTFGGLAGKLTGAFAALGAGSLVKNAIGAAADVGEQFSKLSVLVGDSAKDLDAWAKTTASSIGVSRQEALQGLGTFANLFQVMGKGQDETAAMSKRFVELATDMASFNNANPAEVIEALGAALRGESEPIRRFGVMLDDATLKQRAFSMGLIGSTKEALSPAVKMQAAYAEVLAQTAKQQGDVTRTAGSLSNQTRFLAAEFKDLQAKLGEQLLPIAAQVVSAIRSGLLPAMQNVVPIVAGLAEAAFNAAAGLGAMLAPLAGGASQLAVYAAGATASYAALQKVVQGAGSAQRAFAGLGAALSTPLGVAGFGAVLIGGALTYALVEHQKEAAASKDRQEKLTQALREAGDPVQLLGDRFKALADELDKLKPKQDDAAKGIEGVGGQYLFSALQAKDAATAFNRTGVSLETATKALSYSDAEWLKFIANLRNSAGAAGVVGREQNLVINALRESRDALKASREEIARNMKAGLEAAVVAGKLSQAELDKALATSTATDELFKWYEVGQKYAGLLPEATEANKELAKATDEAAKADDNAVMSAEDRAKAEKDVADAIEDRLEATWASANADLAFERQQRSLAESSQVLQQRQANLAYAIRTFGANSKEAAGAQYEYDKALAETKSETLQTASAAVELAKKQAEAEGKTLSARDANQLMIDKLVGLRDATGDPQLQAYIDTLIGKYRDAGKAAEVAAAQIAELSRQAAIQAGATQGQGMGIITSAAQAERLAGQRAAGGPVGAGKSYLVGENGPEVLTMGSQSGRIAPNGALGGGGPTVVVNASGVIAQDLNTFAAAAASAIHEALRRLEAARR